MDKPISKYIQYKIRTLEKRKRELYDLYNKREKLRQEIIDESAAPMDGQPKGKGNSSSPVETKVIKLEKIDRRILNLDNEIAKFQDVERKIHLMGREAYLVYKHTIADNLNPEYVAMEIGISRRTLFYMKSGIMKFIAEELGEYIELKK